MQKFNLKFKTFYFLLVFLTFTFCLLPFPSSLSAHILKTSGSIGAVVHIDPEDDPIAGEPSNFYFEFKDKKNTFKPQNCTCIVSILEAGKEIYTQSLFQNSTSPSLTSASFSFTFPKRDIYTVKVIGTPTDASFESFTLVYDIRVERISNPNQQTKTSNNFFSFHSIHFLGAIVAGLFLIFAIIKTRKYKNIK